MKPLYAEPSVHEKVYSKHLYLVNHCVSFTLVGILSDVGSQVRGHTGVGGRPSALPGHDVAEALQPELHAVAFDVIAQPGPVLDVGDNVAFLVHLKFKTLIGESRLLMGT